jgi:hypothetical protein
LANYFTLKLYDKYLEYREQNPLGAVIDKDSNLYSKIRLFNERLNEVKTDLELFGVKENYDIRVFQKNDSNSIFNVQNDVNNLENWNTSNSYEESQSIRSDCSEPSVVRQPNCSLTLNRLGFIEKADINCNEVFG